MEEEFMGALERRKRDRRVQLFGCLEDVKKGICSAFALCELKGDLAHDFHLALSAIKRIIDAA